MKRHLTLSTTNHEMSLSEAAHPRAASDARERTRLEAQADPDRQVGPPLGCRARGGDRVPVSRRRHDPHARPASAQPLIERLLLGQVDRDDQELVTGADMQ